MRFSDPARPFCLWYRMSSFDLQIANIEKIDHFLIVLPQDTLCEFRMLFHWMSTAIQGPKIR